MSLKAKKIPRMAAMLSELEGVLGNGAREDLSISKMATPSKND
jgi:hypothetical protein